MPRKTPLFLLFAAILATVIVAASCSPTPPSREPDIRGTITGVTISGSTGQLLIEETPGETGDNKASVSITADTGLFRRVDGASPEPITLDDITEGMQADAWFTGPVAESYPVQATGEAVLVSE